MTDGTDLSAQLKVRVMLWAERLNVYPRLIRVQRMTQKWGSCSTLRTITLAVDLAEQDIEFQNFVIAHELLHIRIPNHGRLFKALMSAHIPDWRSLENSRRAERDISSPTERRTVD